VGRDTFGGRPRRGGEAALTGVDEMHGFNLSTVTASSFEPTRRRKTLAPRSRTS